MDNLENSNNRLIVIKYEKHPFNKIETSMRLLSHYVVLKFQKQMKLKLKVFFYHNLPSLKYNKKN